MGRKRQNSSLIIAAAQLCGLFFMALFLIPGVRQVIVGCFEFVIILVPIALVVLICVRWAQSGNKRGKTIESYLSVNTPLPTQNDYPYLVNLQPGVQERNKPVPWVSSCIPVPSPAPPTKINLPEKLRSIDWFQFEKLVATLYQKLGYEVTRKGGANPDGGIDLVLEKNGLKIAVQCKQWKTWNVGVKAIREFLGALTDSGITKGYFVTLCGYTGESKLLAEKHGIAILNEADLLKLLETVNAKYDPEIIELLNDPRKVCPKCERDLVLREAKKGRGLGGKFWGCSTYPKCRFTMPV